MRFEVATNEDLNAQYTHPSSTWPFNLSVLLEIKLNQQGWFYLLTKNFNKESKQAVDILSIFAGSRSSRKLVFAQLERKLDVFLQTIYIEHVIILRLWRMLHEHQQQFGGWGERHQERQGWSLCCSIWYSICFYLYLRFFLQQLLSW